MADQPCKTCGDRGTMPPPTTEEKDRGRTFYPCPDCDTIERIVEEAMQEIEREAQEDDSVFWVPIRTILRAALRKAQREAWVDAGKWWERVWWEFSDDAQPDWDDMETERRRRFPELEDGDG